VLARTVRSRGDTAIGEVISGRLDVPGQADQYTLTTDGPHTISLADGAGSCTDVEIHLADADGTSVGLPSYALCRGTFLSLCPPARPTPSRCTASVAAPGTIGSGWSRTAERRPTSHLIGIADPGSTCRRRSGSRRAIRVYQREVSAHRRPPVASVQAARPPRTGPGCARPGRAHPRLRDEHDEPSEAASALPEPR
jgi:hypothetical protein